MKGIRKVALLCLMIGGSLLVAGQVATAAPPLRFGANISSNDFPDNSYQGRYCDKIVDGGSDPYNCTWIEDEAKNSSTPKATARAPKDGYIDKIRLIEKRGGKSGVYRAKA